jgi:hypothetical protein
MAQLREILVARETHYQQAQCHLDTTGKTVDESTSELIQLINSHNIFPNQAP